jgi:hypothetical protein
MMFADTPEARRQLDRQLDPNDPVLLDSDLNRVVGNLTELARIMLRSIHAMSPAEKQSVRDALNGTDAHWQFHGRRYCVSASDW